MVLNKLMFVIAFLAISASLTAQEYRFYFEIKFTDKESVYNLDLPLAFLSEKSVRRRQDQGILLDNSDLPIPPTYLKEVLNKPDVHFVTKSKWFNTLIIGMQDTSAIQKLRKENYVKKIVLLPISSDKTGGRIVDKEEELMPADYVIKSEYGNAFNQFNMLNGSYLHSKGFKGNGVLMAIIDAGFINANSAPAFQSLNSENRILATYDFVENDTWVYEKSTHGSHVFSTIAADDAGEMIGTAPEADFLLLRSEDGAAEYILEEYFWVAAAEFADSAGAAILNTSLGYTVFDDSLQDHSYEDLDGNTTVITRGSDKAATKGMLVINSAGNSGNNNWFYIGAPADGDSVLAVGAVDKDARYVEFSSKGPSADNRIKPNVSAQGFGAVVAGLEGGSFAGSGTSFSSPILAGLAACLWQANPTATNMEIFRAIEGSANRYTFPDSLTGYGVPDFGLADLLLKSNTDRQFTSKIKTFPNPVEGSLNILLPQNGSSKINVRITDYSGREVYNYSRVAGAGLIRFEEIEGLNALESGYYVISIETDDGLYQSKMIKS